VIVILRVLYLLNYAGKAGTERYIESLVKRLTGKIQAYFAYNQSAGLEVTLEKMNIKTFKIRMSNRFDLKAAWELSLLCKSLNIDIVHTHYLRENYIALLSRIFNPSVKVVYTNHFIMKNTKFTKITNAIFTKFQAGIIAVCNKGNEMLADNKLDKKKITTIYNGTEIIPENHDLRISVRQELGIDSEMFMIFCASRFAYDKGHDFLVNSIYELKKITEKRFKCILAADGPLIDKIKKQVDDLNLNNEVVFIGYQNDIQSLLLASDLYINSSHHEALSFLIIEALAAGLPVIATDVGGNGEIINKITNCGILVKYNDSKGLAEEINKVINNNTLRTYFSENALKAVSEIFSTDKQSNETLKIYENVCKQ
jgi:glycosyltransferase involved in cell wall biosynthesis